MKRAAVYEIVTQDDKRVLLRDLGPWDRYPTITNDAEGVVAAMALQLGNRKLEYMDSDGLISELLVKDGKFAGFA
jgi:hypothetical protein